MVESNRFGCQLRTDTFNDWIHEICCASAMRNSSPRSRHQSSFSTSNVPLFPPPTLSLLFVLLLPSSPFPLCLESQHRRIIRDFTSAGSDPITAHFPRKLFRGNGLFPRFFASCLHIDDTSGKNIKRMGRRIKGEIIFLHFFKYF